MDIQTVYLYGLIIAGSLTILYLLFGDVFESISGLSEIAPGSILNPVVILSFIAILSGSGYVMEIQEKLGSLSIFVISVIIAFIIVSIIHLFILVPLSKSEQSTASSIHDFIGKDGEVITTIPENGVGEIFISSVHGSTGNIAKCVNQTEIVQGSFVLVIDVDDEGVLIVTPYKDENRTFI